jgi:hypothetical protein
MSAGSLIEVPEYSSVIVRGVHGICLDLDRCPDRGGVCSSRRTRGCIRKILCHNRIAPSNVLPNGWNETRKYPPAMHRNVEVLIGRLATDPDLRDRFARAPFDVLREQRLELSEVEIAALAATNPDAFRALAAALDARLRRAPLTAESRTAGGALNQD